MADKHNTFIPIQPSSVVAEYSETGHVPQDISQLANACLTGENELTQTSGTILVVDDNPINLKILYNTLIKGGYRVVPAQDARSAISRLNSVTPNLILLDIMMPEVNGFELYAQLRRYPQITDVPIMFISALSDVETIEQGFALGAVDYITKPFRAVEVLGRVSAHIRLKSLQDALIATNVTLQALLDRHQCILNGAGDGIFGVNADAKLTFINNRALEQLGYATADLTAVNIHEAIHHSQTDAKHDDADPCPILDIARKGHSRIIGVDRFYHQDGHFFPVEFTASGLTDANRSPMAVVLFRDISERLQTERRLKEAAAVFEVSCEGIFLTDPNGVIQRINPAFSELTGYQASEVIGQNPRIFKSGRHTSEFYTTMWEQLGTNGTWEGEIWNRRSDGSVFPEWEMITAIRDTNAQVVDT